jgi:hypothetical protein
VTNPIKWLITPSRRPKVRNVLLDRSFVDALEDPESSDHASAVALYTTLVNRYEAGLDRLHALSTVLTGRPRPFRRRALAPVLSIYASRQYRSAARRVRADLRSDAALAAVAMRRSKIRAVATVTSDYDELDIEVLRPLDRAAVADTDSAQPVDEVVDAEDQLAN